MTRPATTAFLPLPDDFMAFPSFEFDLKAAEFDLEEMKHTLTSKRIAKTAQSTRLKDRRENKRQKHCASMVAFRKKKKGRFNQLVMEHRQLELMMKRIISHVRVAAASNSTMDAITTSSCLRDLVVEKEALRKQNAALLQKVKQHETLQRIMVESSYLEDEEALLPVDETSGWRVHFEDGAPSFHFHPFTRNDFDNAMTQASTNVSNAPASMQMVGHFLGWNVQHVTGPSTSTPTALLARSRFTKRVPCSIQLAFQAMLTEDRNSWPVVVSPINWARRFGGVCTQLLQAFDENSCIIVSNIHHDGHLRYFCLCERSKWTTRGGQRAVTYTMTIADSKANERSRSVESMRDGVEWVREAGLLEI